MATIAQNSYAESRVLSADPMELIQILYEQALDAVDRARYFLREGDIRSRSSEISRALAIVVELSMSVNREADPVLGQNLVELYDFMQRRLLEANSRQIEPPLAEVEKLLTTMLEGWRSCRSSEQAPAHQHAAAAAIPMDPRLMAFEEPCEVVRQSWTA